MEIREVKTTDYKAIAELSCQLGHEMSEEEARERIEKLLNDPTQRIFIAERGEEILGYVNVVAIFELLSGIQGRIWGLVVDEHARGLGVGRQLMQKAEEWAQKMGSKTMKVNSNVTRKEAHTFYEKIGYVKYKEQAIFKKGL